MSVDFSRVRARSLLFILVGWLGLCWMGPAVFDEVLDGPWQDALLYLALDVSLLAWLWWQCRRAGTTMAGLIGEVPRDPAAWRRIWLTPVLLIFSMGCFFLLWLPLSWVWPGFVQTVVLEYPAVWEADHPGPSLLEVFSFVLSGPILEELIFRGVLLRRWASPGNEWRALLVSSFIFAIFHIDPIGAFAFGLVMGLLYAATGSLWVPIACHILNNAIAFALEFTPLIDQEYNVAKFQSEWPLGLGCLLAGTAGLFFLRRWFVPAGSLDFPLPKPARLPTEA